MKMPTMNFDFGPFTESGVVALSPYGIAVRSSKGEYLTYNAATGATVDVTGFTFDFQKMPAAIKDLRAGDMVLHRGKPMYVQSVEEDGAPSADSDRQYILAKDDIIKISKLYGSRFIIITSKIAPAITLEYKDAKAAEATYEDLMLQLCNLHT